MNQKINEEIVGPSWQDFTTKLDSSLQQITEDLNYVSYQLNLRNFNPGYFVDFYDDKEMVQATLYINLNRTFNSLTLDFYGPDNHPYGYRLFDYSMHSQNDILSGLHEFHLTLKKTTNPVQFLYQTTK